MNSMPKERLLNLEMLLELNCQCYYEFYEHSLRNISGVTESYKIIPITFENLDTQVIYSRLFLKKTCREREEERVSARLTNHWALS